MTVDGIDFYVTETFGEGLYESCKDVKFGTMNTRAIDFVGAGASNFEGDPLKYREIYFREFMNSVMKWYYRPN